MFSKKVYKDSSALNLIKILALNIVLTKQLSKRQEYLLEL